MGTQEPRRRFHSIPLRRSAPLMTSEDAQISTRRTTSSYVQKKPSWSPRPDVEEEESEQDSFPVQIPRSARRYTDSQGREVFQQGNRRMVVRHAKRPRRVHWALPAGIGMLSMLALVLLGMWGATWWDQHQLNATYGYPRYWQTDQVLGIDHDSPSHESHLIFQNLNGHVFFVVIPAGDEAQARIYPVLVLHGEDAASVPVTATFADVNGDGRLDILIHVGDQTIVFVNTGTGFKPQQ